MDNTGQFTAQHNFDHQVTSISDSLHLLILIPVSLQIATFKIKEHVLVTNGIYKIFRHPGYFGFYLWALGTQVRFLLDVLLLDVVRLDVVLL